MTAIEKICEGRHKPCIAEFVPHVNVNMFRMRPLSGCGIYSEMNARSYIENLLRDRNISRRELAGRLEVDEKTLRHAAENGYRTLSLDRAYRLARELGIAVEDLLDRPRLMSSGGTLPIRFKTGGGAWIEADDYAHDGLGEATGDRLPQYSRYAQWYEQLEGDSMDLIFPHGALLHVIDALQMGYEPKHDDIVIIERTRSAGFLRERSAKQVALTATGIEFWPRSRNPRWSKPIPMNEDDGDESVTVQVVGLVKRGIISL